MNIRHLYRELQRCLVVTVVVAGCTGCFSSSVRFTRSNGTEKQIVSGRDDSVQRPLSVKSASKKHETVYGATPDSIDRLATAVESYIGVPYHYGGSSRRGMDCSGFVSVIYQQIYGLNLPRSSAQMYRLGSVQNRESARPGDLVFFYKRGTRRVNHVGIFLGGRLFAHASPRAGVVYASLESDYYRHAFAAFRRLIP